MGFEPATAIQQLMGLTARPLGRRCNGAGWGGEGGSAAVGSPTGAAGEERGKECSRGIAHRRCLGRGGGWIAAVGSPTGAAGEGGRWSAAVGSPTGAPGGGWRVGGQPWDGPLALPRKGGV